MSINIPWSDLADVYGFIGNSLLKPMTQTADAGIDPGFWASFYRGPSVGLDRRLPRTDSADASRRLLRRVARTGGKRADMARERAADSGLDGFAMR